MPTPSKKGAKKEHSGKQTKINLYIYLLFYINLLVKINVLLLLLLLLCVQNTS